jgi:hypothetical protein
MMGHSDFQVCLFYTRSAVANQFFWLLKHVTKQCVPTISDGGDRLSQTRLEKLFSKEFFFYALKACVSIETTISGKLLLVSMVSSD